MKVGVQNARNERGATLVEYSLFSTIFLIALLPLVGKLGRESCNAILEPGFAIFWANQGDNMDIAEDAFVPDAFACGGGTEGTVEAGGRPGPTHDVNSNGSNPVSGNGTPTDGTNQPHPPFP